MSEELVIETETLAPPASAVPPPPQEPTAPFHVMSAGEPFSREQYHAAGWSDDQLIAAGKMIVIAPPPEDFQQIKAAGLPNSKWIILDDNDDIPPTGLFLGHNGNSYMIQTGMPVLVPEHVLSVLDDAVMSAPVQDPKTKQVIGYRDRPRYTYREVSAPKEA